FNTYNSFATHVVGGAFDVQWISGTNYQVSLRMLRDCSSSSQADFNKPNIRVGLYEKSNNNLVRYFTINFISSNKLQFVSLKCASPSNACTEEGLYTGIVSLPNLNSNTGYYISWERCCRNGIINNIVDPGGASQAFYAEIPRNNFNNSTPKYNNPPITLMCVGVPFTYNFDFTDRDNDSLVYTLVDPLNGNLDRDRNNGDGSINTAGPYQPINWLNGFSATIAIQGSPSLFINSKTGEINVTPNAVGTFVASIRVVEFRNGVKIGEVRLELQFNVVACVPNPMPIINYSDTGNSLNQKTFYEVEIPNTICFDINANDLSDSLYMTITSPHFSSNFTSQPTVQKTKAGFKNIVNRFCWQTTCELSKVGFVTFTSDVKDNGCPFPRTSKSEIIIRIKPMRTFPAPSFKCLGLLNNRTQLNWSDTNSSPLLKSYRIYRGINDSGYVLLGEVGKIVNQYLDNNSPNNKIINYTYKIASVNECDSEGVASKFVSTLLSIPAIVKNDSLLANIPQDTIDFLVNENKCFFIKAQDIGDSLLMKISSPLFSNGAINPAPEVNKLVYGKDSVISQFCWTPPCEAYSLKYIPIDIDVQDLSCPISNLSNKRIWIKVLPLDPINSTDMLCMTLSNDNQTYVYYGDTTPAKLFNYFLVYRGIDNKNFVVIDTIRNKSQRFFLDKNTPTNKLINYCYFMIGVNKCGVLGFNSDTITTFEQINYLPQQQSLFTVTVDTNEHIGISWFRSTEKDFAKYYLYKSTDNGVNFNQIKTFEEVSDTQYVDKEVDVNLQSYCYHLVMFDTCDNIGPQGKIACSIFLKGNATYLNHQLNWNNYIGWPNGTSNHDVFRRYVSKPFSLLAKQNPNNYNDKDFDTDEGAYYYYVNANEAPPDGISNRGLAQSKSNKIFLFQQPNVYPPNAFSSNGDGLNDDLYLSNSFVKTYNLKIFNRWGQLIFESDNKKERWKGELNNNSVQNDVYFYIVTFTGFDDYAYTKRGNITIIR
ncbi:MAG: gliding motility-associated C-terminal domain-containing protein, partial [Bacteroidia bacterium]|nr:gliding motility-associated C-terminal domain-containing protein [Bacteroidia bacterium]